MHDGFHEPSAVERDRFSRSKTTVSISTVYGIFSPPNALGPVPSRSASLEKWKKYVPFIPLIPTLAVYPWKCCTTNPPLPKLICLGQFGNS
jgi:hypothetical protein